MESPYNMENFKLLDLENFQLWFELEAMETLSNNTKNEIYSRMEFLKLEYDEEPKPKMEI